MTGFPTYPVTASAFSALANRIEARRRVAMNDIERKMIVDALRRFGHAQQAKEPVGYGYSAEIQSSGKRWFAVYRDCIAPYDTPLYVSDTSPDCEAGK